MDSEKQRPDTAEAAEGEQLAVQICEVSKSFGTGEHAVQVLHEVSLDIRENEFFTLLGPSGCGKTTLLRLIGGFEFPDEGDILLEGTNITHDPPNKRPVNTVFQNYALFPHLTVADNIAFGLRMLRWPSGDIHQRVREMLALVRMEELGFRRTDKISGGQQQRVALARALAPSPKVLLLDEPLSALDYKLRKEMQLELKRMQDETGITFIFVTHDQEEALAMSDRMGVMSEGRVLQVGASRDIYDRPSGRFVADFIGETNFLKGEIVFVSGDKALVKLGEKAAISAHLPAGDQPQGEVTVVVRPEYAEVAAEGGADTLPGVVDTVTYTGADTHYHVTLDEGFPFKVRSQNDGAGGAPAGVGDRVGVRFTPNSAWILGD